MEVYIANLNAYNDGRLEGEYAEASDYDDLMSTVESVSNDGEDEVMIHDYEGYNLGERSDWDKVHELSVLLDEGPAAEVYMGHVGEDFANLENFQESYVGSYKNEEDFAYEWLNDTGQLSELPDWAHSYFDYEGWARNALMDSMFGYEREGQLHVFWRQ